MGTKHVGMRSADQKSTVRNSSLRFLTGTNGSVMKGNALQVRGLGRLLRYKDQHRTHLRAGSAKVSERKLGHSGRDSGPLSRLHSKEDPIDKCSPVPFQIFCYVETLTPAQGSLQYFFLFKNFLQVYHLKEH